VAESDAIDLMKRVRSIRRREAKVMCRRDKIDISTFADILYVIRRYIRLSVRKSQYPASGHASGEDITWAIEQIDPDYIVPIHTEARDWFAKSFENVVLV
jgi:mRNA degradation ribonuclease J1/J2